jgi:glyoxylase-like metal-dependent hydrolase (beta-lactamase superfamily II)
MTLPISDGIYQITLPVPFWARHVNLYLIEHPDGCALVDCGIDTDELFAALENELREIGVTLGDISRILITHCHHDHYGMVGRIKRVAQTTVAMHSTETERADRIYRNARGDNPGYRQLLLSYGLPEEYADQAEQDMLEWRGFVDPTAVDDELSDGQQVRLGYRAYQVLHTPGHTAGHACFYDPDRRLLLAGDFLSAERIPHVGVTVFTGGNPLRQYLDSLQRVSDLDVDVALPGHGKPITDHRRRIEEITAHYTARAERVLQAFQDGAPSAHEVAVRAFGGDLSTFEGRLAFTETLAHLELLASEGGIERYQDGATTLFRRGSA